jgi:DNA-binding response OmpR family regulator
MLTDRIGRDGVAATVVVVDDEPNIVDFLQLGLRHEGFTVHSAADGRDGLHLVRAVKPDLLILDVMLPELDGLSLLRRLRAEGSDVPVLLLTAKDELEDKVAGLDLGADDYLTKPFRLEELLARVRALLRRHGRGPKRTLSYGDVSLNPETREVSRGDRALDLTPREFDLLRYFLEHPRSVLERRALLLRVWGYDFGGDTNVVDVYVGYLRRKLGEPDLIQTVRGIGYSLREA